MSDETSAAKRFWMMCDDFHPQLYAHYGLLSDFMHPSAAGVNRAYLDPDGETAVAVSEAALLAAAQTAAASAIWAGRALDGRTSGHPAGQRLTAAASELPISPYLYLGMPGSQNWPI